MVVLEVGVALWRTFVSTLFCNIAQEPQEQHRFNCVCEFIGKSAFKISSIAVKIINCNNEKYRFDQLAAAYSSSPPELMLNCSNCRINSCNLNSLTILQGTVFTVSLIAVYILLSYTEFVHEISPRKLNMTQLLVPKFLYVW